MSERLDAPAVIIRPAVSDDAEAIAQTYIESAEHHASLDPDRYWIPAADSIVTRYRDGRQHPPEEEGVTLVAEVSGAVVGFVDARIETSPDPMHRDLVYCHIAEIAVSRGCQSMEVGEKLLRRAEQWGKQKGAQLAFLEYLASNTRAASFYHQRMGYGVVAMMAAKRL